MSYEATVIVIWLAGIPVSAFAVNLIDSSVDDLRKRGEFEGILAIMCIAWPLAIGIWLCGAVLVFWPAKAGSAVRKLLIRAEAE